jgi:outer membrane protein TolC
LQTQLQALNFDTLQLSSSVDLILALGGGWQANTSAQEDRRFLTDGH